MAAPVDALSFLAFAVLVATIGVAEPDPPDRAQRHLGRELVEGLAWVYRHAMLAPMAFWGTSGSCSMRCSGRSSCPMRCASFG